MAWSHDTIVEPWISSGLIEVRKHSTGALRGSGGRRQLCQLLVGLGQAPGPRGRSNGGRQVAGGPRADAAACGLRRLRRDRVAEEHRPGAAGGPAVLQAAERTGVGGSDGGTADRPGCRGRVGTSHLGTGADLPCCSVASERSAGTAARSPRSLRGSAVTGTPSQRRDRPGPPAHRINTRQATHARLPTRRRSGLQVRPFRRPDYRRNPRSMNTHQNACVSP